MKKTLHLKPLLPFLIILIIAMGSYAYIYFHPQIWGSLRYFYLNLKDFNIHHPILTPLLFALLYIAYTLLLLPGIFILALLAGFLFPQPLSTLYVIASGTIGASLLFLAARTAFREILSRNSSPLLNRLEHGFRKNGINYMLFLRLVPLFPFKIVNLAGAFFCVSFRDFAWTTCIGMIPSVLIYTQAGGSFASSLDHSDILDPWIILNPTLIIALTALAILPLLPLVIKRIRKKAN